jgi:hypothetical protein
MDPLHEYYTLTTLQRMLQYAIKSNKDFRLSKTVAQNEMRLLKDIVDRELDIVHKYTVETHTPNA